MLALVAFVFLTGAEAERPADADPNAEAHGPSPALECGAGDPIMRMKAIRAAHDRGGQRSPEEAVRREVTRYYPKLSPEVFRQSRSNGRAVFVHDRDGRPVAVAEVEQVADAWEVHEFSGCASVLAEARPGGAP